MAQINLLKQNTRSNTMWQHWPSFVVKFLALIVVGLVTYYGWIWYQSNQVADAISKENAAITAGQKDLATIPGQEELWTRQAQLKELAVLLGQHPNWTALFPALAKVTLTKAGYLSMNTLPDGSLSLMATVPSMDDLDKFLQIFDLPEVNQNFSNVKLGSISKTQVGNSLVIKFDVRLKYSTALLNQPLPFN